MNLIYKEVICIFGTYILCRFVENVRILVNKNEIVEKGVKDRIQKTNKTHFYISAKFYDINYEC